MSFGLGHRCCTSRDSKKNDRRHYQPRKTKWCAPPFPLASGTRQYENRNLFTHRNFPWLSVWPHTREVLSMMGRLSRSHEYHRGKGCQSPQDAIKRRINCVSAVDCPDYSFSSPVRTCMASRYGDTSVATASTML